MCIVHLHPGSLHCLWSLGPSASSLPSRCPVSNPNSRAHLVPGTCYTCALSSPTPRAHLGSHSLTPHSIKTSQQRPEFHCRTWLRGSRWLDWLLSPSSPSVLPLCFLSGGGPQVFDDDDDHELSTLPWFWSDSVLQVLMMIVMLKMNGN